MINAIRAEFRKLLTVRSTYLNVGSCLLIIVLFAGLINGFQLKAAADLHNPRLLVDQSAHAVIFVGLILAFVGLLLASNEYRYNTIMYTLTATNRRLKILLSKILVVTVFAVITSLIVTFFSPLCSIIGLHLGHHTLVHQTYDVWSVVWRCVFCGWGYAMYALILLFIIRNQVGAIVTFLLLPLIGENILGLLLKKNVIYLPFNAVQSVADPTGLGNHTTSGHEAVVVLVYIAVGFIVSALLFLRRDAN